LSLFADEDRKELAEEWQFMACEVNEFRKLCVERGGLSLLVAYLLEGIQWRAAAIPGDLLDLSQRMN